MQSEYTKQKPRNRCGTRLSGLLSLEARAGVEPTYTDLQSQILPTKSTAYNERPLENYLIKSASSWDRIIGLI